MTHKVYSLIQQGEGESLDFKQTISSASKIAKTLVAFANHKGGKLLVGVTDKGQICGVKSEDEIYMIDLAASFYCKPEIEPTYELFELAGKTVLICTVAQGLNKPYYAKDEDGKWWVHVRVKDKSLLASKILVDVLKRTHEQTPTLIQYTKLEQGMLTVLNAHQKLTLKQICKLLNISRWRAQRTLINLVSAGVIRNHTYEKEEFFTLS